MANEHDDSVGDVIDHSYTHGIVTGHQLGRIVYHYQHWVQCVNAADIHVSVSGYFLDLGQCNRLQLDDWCDLYIGVRVGVDHHTQRRHLD